MFRRDAAAAAHHGGAGIDPALRPAEIERGRKVGADAVQRLIGRSIVGFGSEGIGLDAD